ncbi:precorrin-3B synthase [Thiohalospira halophila DSM 15071]|uniref:Precorrin-3B synthase n=1 Tax=Thiohalospira halophila DSM 15071 TaxID=1123397 RepID=A0A1I1Q503_9GAMM|nr:precorrin-3B synthase [Thiohalospira halophila]SFD17067.1 precorrin-3B synthase [Thiohalospira halophila DSM 15071]
MSGVIRNACPGVAAPMATGDGLLLRLRQPLAGLTASAARAVAEAAEAHGSGTLELTMRAGLQLRGIAPQRAEAAHGRLVAAGLAESDAGREAVRNVVAAPLADRDPAAAADITAVAEAVANTLTADPALQALPPKVGVVVDGGGGAHVGEVTGDLRLEAVDPGRFRVALGGTAADAEPLGSVAVEAAPALVSRLLHRFLALRDADPYPPGRVAAAVSRYGTAPFIEAAGDALGPVADRPLEPVSLERVLGPQNGWLGAAFPFGVLEARQLRRLAELLGPGGTLRVTPWRTLALTDPLPGAEAELAPGGAILDPGDPRLALEACPGRAGCSAGTTATRPDATAAGAAVPALIAAGGRLHVAGCDKACGAPTQPALTLVAEAGHYTLALGSADGPVLRAGLDPAAVPATLAALDAALRHHRQNGEGTGTTLARLGPEFLRTWLEEASDPE